VVTPGDPVNGHTANFVIEIFSFEDRTREKVPFYEKLGVRELLLVDREPWQLELYRHESGRLQKVAPSAVESGATISSAVVPLWFQFVGGTPRPRIEVQHLGTGRDWLV
jgi:hypothetical protein